MPRADRESSSRPAHSCALSQPSISSRARPSDDHRHRPRTARRLPHPAVRHHPAGAARRPDRPGRPQRRRQDHHASRCSPARASRTPADRPARAEVGYLPQDPRTGDLERHRPRPGALRPRPGRAAHRDAEARGAARGERRRQADPPLRRARGPVRRLGGYAAEAEAARICSNLGLPDRVLAQTIGTLSGGQRRRIELARILFRELRPERQGILLLDEPTNHLDADSITWLRGYLAAHKGGLIVISHDVVAARGGGQQGLVPGRQPRRWSTSTTWAGRRTWRSGRPTSGAARRERANAEKKAGALMAQADKMRAKATKTVAAQNMARRAEKLLAGLEEVRVLRQGGEGALPRPRRRAARRR